MGNVGDLKPQSLGNRIPNTVTGWCNTGTHDSATERDIIRQGRISCSCPCHKGENNE